MGRQRRNTAKKKSTCSPAHDNDSHQSKEQKANNCTLNVSQICSNCSLPINTSTSKTHQISQNSNQQQSSPYPNNARDDDPPTSDDLNEMISIIYNLDFIPRLVELYPNAISSEDAQVTDFPLCCFCTNLFKSLFSLYSQFNEIREIESLLSKQINSLHFLINYDGQTQQLNQADDSPKETSESNSTTSDVVNSQETTTTTTSRSFNDKEADDSRGSQTSLASDECNGQDTTTTTTSSSSSRIEFQHTDPEPYVSVEIDLLDDLTVEEIGYVPPSLRHISETEQPRTTTCCHSNATKLEFSSNDPGPWVKVGPRLEDVTIEKEVDPGHAPMTLPKLEQETPQSNLAISDVVSISPAVDEDENTFANDDHDNNSDMDYEPSISSHDYEDEVDDENSLQSDPLQSEDDVKPDAADFKPDLGLDGSESSGEESEPEKKKTKKQSIGLNYRRRQATTPCPCLYCEEDFIYPEDRVAHVRQHHFEGQNYVCEKCGAVFQNQSSFENHKSGADPKCSAFHLEATLFAPQKNKKQLVQGEKDFSCTVVIVSHSNQVCPFQTKHSHAFKNHMITVHTEEKDKVKCDECNREFTSKLNLKKHVGYMHKRKRRKTYERRPKVNVKAQEDPSRGKNEQGAKNQPQSEKQGNENQKNIDQDIPPPVVNNADDDATPVPGEKSNVHVKSKRGRQKLQSVQAEQEEGSESNSETSNDDDDDQGGTKRKRKVKKKASVEKKFPCTVVNGSGQVCPFRASIPSILKEHMFSVHAEEKDRVKCEKCDREFKSKFHLKEHIYRLHTEKGNKRYKERLEKSKEKGKSRTKEIISNSKEFVCPHCSLNFTTKINFTVHLRTVHDDYSGAKRICMCEVCGKKFNDNYKLRRHTEAVHTDERPFACELCGRLCKTQDSLRNHKYASHNKEGKRKNYARYLANLQKKKLKRQEEERKAGIEGSVCPHCGIDFITKFKCTMHRRTAHDDFTGAQSKVVACTLCEKKFEGNVGLKIHMQHVHSDERPFVCDKCGRCFKSYANLQSHESTVHTEEGREKHKLYQRENLRRKKLIREQQKSKEEDEMEAETETSESENDEESEQTRETAVITRSSTSTSTSLLPPPSSSQMPAITLD